MHHITAAMSTRYLAFSVLVTLLLFSPFSSAEAFSASSSRGGRKIHVSNRVHGSLSSLNSFQRPTFGAVPRGGALDTEEDSVAATEASSSPPPSSPSTTKSNLQFAAALSPLTALRPLIDFYGTALVERPILTNCVTAAVLSVTSDAFAQGLERRAKDDATHDARRSAWMAVWGFAVPGLMVYYWFAWLHHLFPVAGLTLVGALKKVGVNQLVMSPGMNGLFFAFCTYTRRAAVGTPRATALRRKLATDLVPTMKRSCVYWGTIQLFNFLVVPSRFAVLFSNVGFLVWTTYISLVGYRAVAAD